MGEVRSTCLAYMSGFRQAGGWVRVRVTIAVSTGNPTREQGTLYKPRYASGFLHTGGRV